MLPFRSEVFLFDENSKYLFIITFLSAIILNIQINLSNEKVVECVKVIKQALRPFGDEKFRCNKEIKIRPNLAQLTQ